MNTETSAGISNTSENYLPGMSAPKEYATSDFGFAAALLSLGFPLLGLDTQNPRRIKFVFQNDAMHETREKDYWNNDMKVSARAMHENIKMIKTRLIQLKGQ